MRGWRKFERARLLAGCFTPGLLAGWPGLLLLWLLWLGVTTLPVAWDGRAVIFLGVVPETLGPRDRQAALTDLIEEFHAWGWLFACFGFVLPAVLAPLAASYSVSHVLWLRLTPCRASDLALARAWRVVLACALAAGASLAWVTLCALYHRVPPGQLLPLTEGVAAHLLLSGGIVVVSGPWLASERARAVFAAVALFAPLLLSLPALTAPAWLPAPVRRWWPGSGPLLVQAFGAEAWRHFLAAATAGAVLLAGSVLAQGGKLSDAPEENQP